MGKYGTSQLESFQLLVVYLYQPFQLEFTSMSMQQVVILSWNRCEIVHFSHIVYLGTAENVVIPSTVSPSGRMCKIGTKLSKHFEDIGLTRMVWTDCTK